MGTVEKQEKAGARSPGELWIEGMLSTLAAQLKIPVTGVSWDLYVPKEKLPEPALIFDVNRKRHSVVFEDSEISECGEANEKTRVLVLERLREKLSAAKRAPSKKKK